jgi:hypothetical protein
MTTPSDDDLTTFITTRLALAGIDLGQLPAVPDPVTGSPTREQALESLRSFLAGPLVDGARTGSTVAAINRWRPAPGGPDAPALAQQLAVPTEYPSITQAWTGRSDT